MIIALIVYALIEYVVKQERLATVLTHPLFAIATFACSKAFRNVISEHM
jgi:hypothetical protein